MKQNFIHNRMNARITFAALVMFFMGAAVAATAGSKNFKAEIVSPAAGAEINSGKPFTVEVKLTNMGETIYAGDSMMSMPGDKIQLDIKVDGKVEKTLMFMVTQDLMSGKSATMEEEVTLNFAADKKGAQFCANVSVVGYTNTNTGGNPCGNVEKKVFPTAIGNVNTDNVVRVYPNPATSQITISRPEANKAQLAVYDVTGRVVATHSLTSKEQTISISALSAGTYLYRITDENGKATQNGKLMKSE